MNRKAIQIVCGVIVVLVLGVIILCNLNCSQVEAPAEREEGVPDNVVIRVIVFPTGAGMENYCFTVNENLLLESSFGSGWNENLRRKQYLDDVDIQQETQLTEEEMQRILQLANQLEEIGNGSEIVFPKYDLRFDTWDAGVLYQGKAHYSCYSVNEVPVLNELVDEMIQLTPIPVDLRGFA